MALIVEDGSGKLDAESPQSIAALDARMTAMGARGASWAALSTAAKEAAARDGSLVLEARWARHQGRPKTAGQALSFPRVGAWDALGEKIAESTVPEAWKAAHAELALVASVKDLLVALDRGGAVSSTSVGPSGPEKTSFSTTYSPGAPLETAYPRVEALLRNLLRPVGRAPLPSYQEAWP